jgi:hypothetical protein
VDAEESEVGLSGIKSREGYIKGMGVDGRQDE